MARAQWLIVCATAAVAVIAYIRADQIYKRLNFGAYRQPGIWTA